MKIINFCWILLVCLAFVTGLYSGSILQEEHYIKGAVLIAEGLEGTNIEINVDINETQLVEGMTNFFNETLNANQSLQ